MVSTKPLSQIQVNKTGQQFAALYEGVMTSPSPNLLPDVVGRNRSCHWKGGSVHVPNCKPFLVTEAEKKHDRRRARFQQHGDASCHQVFSCKARSRRKITPF